MGQELCTLGGWGAGSGAGGGSWARRQALKRAWVRLKRGGRWHHGLGSPAGQGGLCADTGSPSGSWAVDSFWLTACACRPGCMGTGGGGEVGAEEGSRLVGLAPQDLCCRQGISPPRLGKGDHLLQSGKLRLREVESLNQSRAAHFLMKTRF